MASVVANLLISTVGVAWYLRPLFMNTGAATIAQDRVQQARAQVRSLLPLDERGQASDPAAILAELDDILARTAANLGSDLVQMLPPRQDAAFAPAVVDVPVLLARADHRLASIGNALEKRRADSVDRVTRAQYALLALVVAISLLGVGLCIVGLLTIRTWMVQPIAQLRAATQAVAGGRYVFHSRDLQFPYEDEIAGLGREIESMAGEIARIQEALLDRERRTAAREVVGLVRTQLLGRLGQIRTLAQNLSANGLAGPDILTCRNRILQTVDRFEAWLASLQQAVAPGAAERRPVQLGGVFDNVVRVLQPSAEARGVELVTEIAPDLPEVLLDTERFEHVLVSLGTNAIEASERGRQVRIEARPEPTGGWQLSVIDSGMGIPTDLLDKVFTPFFTTKPQGNGVGLPMAKAIVETHGGTISVESTPGHGCRFTVRMPAGAATTTSSDATPSCPPAATTRP